MSKEEIIKTLKIPSKKMLTIFYAAVLLQVLIFSFLSFSYIARSFLIASGGNFSPIRYDQSFKDAMVNDPEQLFLSQSLFHSGGYCLFIAFYFISILLLSIGSVRRRKKVLKLVNELEDSTTHN